MQKKEEKICSFTQKGCRLQLIEITYLNAGITTNTAGEPMYYDTFKYQIRQNRKIIETTLIENHARKIFAQMVLNIVYQLKIC